MCLGVPMEVIAITAGVARCRAKGVERAVSLALLEGQAVAPGDWVLVHVGYAILTIAADTAASTWVLLDRMLAAEFDREAAMDLDREAAMERDREAAAEDAAGA